MTISIADELSRELENGFSQHTLLALEKICSNYLVLGGSGVFSEETIVLIFVLRQVASDVRGFMSAIEPLTTSLHSKIQNIIEPPLRQSAECLAIGKRRDQVILASRLILARARAVRVEN